MTSRDAISAATRVPNIIALTVTRRLPISAALFVSIALVASACRIPDLGTSIANAPPLAQTSYLYADDHSLIAAFHAEQDRTIVPLKKIPVSVRDAVVAVEDKRFYEHQGVDVQALFRAAYENAQAGTIVQGGSTLTEQYIKNTLLSNEQSYTRKFNEAALAWQMEQEYTKDQILQKYLNTVYFGQGAYGIMAAAHKYFSKEPYQLSLPQSAMLAGLIRAPSTYDPIGGSHKDAIARRDIVLELMYQQGMISATERSRALRAKLDLEREKTKQITYPAPYFVDYLKRWFLSNPKFGATYEERYNLLFNGGLRIFTTLDPQMQAAAEKAVNGTLSESSDPYGAITAIDPRTGEVKAMVGGRDYFAKHSQFAKLNLATGGSTGRQAGSSFKPFVLVAALEDGLSPSKTYPAPGCIDIQTDQPKPWHVCNAEPSGYGSLTIEDATIHSVNVVYAQIIMDVGPERAVKVAKQMGIRCCVGPEPDQYAVTQPIAPLLGVPSAVLGSNETNTLEMASAYGTLATGGVRTDPTPVSKITDSDGKVIYEAHPETKQVIDPEVAAQADSILQKVVQYGTGTAANIGRPQIGKTGTAQNYSDAWFVGAVPQLVAAVWVGYPEGQRSMCCTRIGTVFGGTWPAQIWNSFMTRATAGLPAESFPRGGVDYVKVEVDVTRNCLPNKYTPPGLIKRQTYIAGQEPTEKCTEPSTYERVAVPSVLGLSIERAKQEIEKNGFAVKVSYAQSFQKPGYVIEQSPAAGQMYPSNRTVSITIARKQ